MKSQLPNLSSSYLPKITSHYLEQLIKQSKKPQIISTDLCRNAYKNYDKPSSENNLRLSSDTNKITKTQTSHQTLGQHLDIKSPFYQRIAVKHLGRWKCNCHQNKENIQLPTIKQTHCSHHDQILVQKAYYHKKFQDTLISSIKKAHSNIHQVIEKNNSQYLNYTFENSAKIKEQKAVQSEKNRKENLNKIAKTITEAQIQKELMEILLKQKLDQMYNLDDENKPFEKVLLKRNIWQTKRNIWKIKILNKIQKKILQAKEITSKGKKLIKSKLINTNASMQKLAQSRTNEKSEKQKMLQQIESCLGVLMKNVGSISDLIPKYQSKQTKARISEIFKANLNIEAPHYIKKLRKLMGEIIQDIVVEQTEAKCARTKKLVEKKALIKQTIREDTEKSQTNSNAKSKPQLISTNSLELLNASTVYIEQKIDTKQSANEKNTLQAKAEQSLLSSSISSSVLSSTLLMPINVEHTAVQMQKLSPINKKDSILSGKSSSSQRKYSAAIKLSFISNSLKKNSILSKNRNKLFSNEKKQKKTEENINKKPDQKQELTPGPIKNPLGTNYNVYNPTPSISKQIICEKDELQQSDDDNEEKKRTARALRYFQNERQQDQEMEKHRIDGMVDLLKQKIINKKTGASQHVIPEHYLTIKYDKFCNQKTFKYMVSLVDSFQGAKKFKFIYNQLWAKKKILEDDYVDQILKEFRPLMGSEQELDQWKQYLLECRTKLMVERWNGIIDVGMQSMVEEVEEEVEEVKEEVEEVPKECLIFEKIDESQIAFERYLQKLMRKNQSQPEPIKSAGKLVNLITNPKLQQTKVSQKTINCQIQTHTTKDVFYTVIDHTSTGNCQSQIKIEDGESPTIDRFGMDYKKKVLGYLLKKNPQQFQQLNRNLNEVSRLFGRRADDELFNGNGEERLSIDEQVCA